MRIRETGLLEHDRARATPGYTLLAPLAAPFVELLDMDGKAVHRWEIPSRSGNKAAMLPNGNLMTAERPGPAGRHDREALYLVGEYDWEGKRVWQCEAPGQHHDFVRRANGNTAFLGYERFTEDSRRRLRGGIPNSEMEDGGVLGDYIREVAPDGKVAWEWHAQHDLEIVRYPIHPLNSREEFCHANSLFALPGGDYLVSFRRNSWLLIIDRETRKVRWERHDERWGGQHDAQMLPNGNLLFFANGLYMPNMGVPHSRVIEMDPATGREVWVYKGSPPWSFLSPHISGAQRLWSGNTLICEGVSGRIFEVTPAGDIVWEYVNPHQFPQRGGGGGMGNWVFRASRYAADSPQIRGRLGRSEL